LDGAEDPRRVGGRIAAVEDRAAAHDDVGPHGGHATDVLARHASVHAEQDRPTGLLDEASRLLETSLGCGKERLPAPARVDGHDQEIVHLVEERLDRVNGGARVEPHPADQAALGLVGVDRRLEGLQDAVRL